MLTTRTALTIAFTVFSTSAQALSCMAPSLSHSFAQAQDSDALYHVALGKLTIPSDFTPPPPPEDVNNPTPYSVQAQFDGHVGTGAGFNFAHTGPVTIDVTCAAAWCGGLPDDTTQIMFLEVTDAGLRLEMAACPGSTFAADAENFATARACLAGDCPAP